MKYHWFRAKRYGYGWYPITWQGWAVILGYVAVVLGAALLLTSTPTDEMLVPFFATIIVALVVMIWICVKTGDPLRWRWGEKKDNDK